ncbi:hypothetical protein [uncultured Roseibium sp.]|uniref:hypothetical protein n=1 Tax=uncultured Roseibium sp. TaxID=1936171 RepID=UPI0032162154
MLSMIRDIPFIDAIAPVVIAAMLWTGANVFVIGPDFIAPRLADKTWRPQCNATVENAKTTAVQQWQDEIDRARQQQRSEQDQMNALTGALLGQFFGEDFNRAFGKDLSGAMTALSELETRKALQERFGHSGPVIPVTGDYCGCVIAEALEDRVSLGLFSASFRIWRPANIQRLDQLSTRLVASPRCGGPKHS